jgi:hypothetical protein
MSDDSKRGEEVSDARQTICSSCVLNDGPAPWRMDRRPDLAGVSIDLRVERTRPTPSHIRRQTGRSVRPASVSETISDLLVTWIVRESQSQPVPKFFAATPQRKIACQQQCHVRPPHARTPSYS